MRIAQLSRASGRCNGAHDVGGACAACRTTAADGGSGGASLRRQLQRYYEAAIVQLFALLADVFDARACGMSRGAV